MHLLCLASSYRYTTHGYTTQAAGSRQALHDSNGVLHPVIYYGDTVFSHMRNLTCAEPPGRVSTGQPRQETTRRYAWRESHRPPSTGCQIRRHRNYILGMSRIVSERERGLLTDRAEHRYWRLFLTDIGTWGIM